ncbi:MAG: hypothetical protein WC059_01485 [Candidatus Paceibacterota bacterium]
MFHQRSPSLYQRVGHCDNPREREHLLFYFLSVFKLYLKNKNEK